MQVLQLFLLHRSAGERPHASATANTISINTGKVFWFDGLRLEAKGNFIIPKNHGQLRLIAQINKKGVKGYDHQGYF